MIIFLAKRASYMLLTMLVVSLLVFLFLEINVESIAVRVLGQFTTPEQRHLWLEANGYLDPLWVRYFRWLGNMLTGDFGYSLVFKEPVAEVLLPRLVNTAILGAVVLAIIVPLSLTLGVLAGMREGSPLDRVISVGAVVTTSVPEFASVVLMSAVFVYWLGWLPGTSSMLYGFEPLALILPVSVLALYDVGYVTRMTRVSMAEVMHTAYIRTAILKGLPYKQVILRHALRNALITPFTVIMLQVNWLLSGVIVVESAFAYDGFGNLLLQASLAHDIELIEACALVAVFVAVGTQVLADIGYSYLNPRIRFT